MLIYLLKFVHTRKEIHGKQVYMAYGKNEIINFVMTYCIIPNRKITKTETKDKKSTI